MVWPVLFPFLWQVHFCSFEGEHGRGTPQYNNPWFPRSSPLLKMRTCFFALLIAALAPASAFYDFVLEKKCFSSAVFMRGAAAAATGTSPKQILQVLNSVQKLVF